ncbi:MAG TPA: cytochrome P460 family protein [Bryobacteraceae bacterium]
MKITNTIAILSLASVAAYIGVASAANSPRTAGVVDASGHLRVPTNYRTTYQFLGTWAIAKDKGQGSKQIHDVYASPGAVAAFRKSGHFPDGTVLVKEVYATATQPMKTGIVSHAKTLQGWFVMVKQSKNRHPGNQLWGEGWIWSWFNAADPFKTTSTSFNANCKGCHLPARQTDWVYTQGYPILKNESH